MNWTTAQQADLLASIQKRNERIILQNQLDHLTAELVSRQQEQTNLRDRWQNEQADVDRLQRLSWASIWADLLANKEQKLTKEEAEAQQARLRYDAVCALVHALQQQCVVVENHLKTYANIDADYERLITEKRATFSNRTDESGKLFQNYLTKLSEQNRQMNELAEAHRAGLRALDAVIPLRKLLDEAHRWGTWDMLGGSSFSSMIKYQKLDAVRDQSERVSVALQQFKAEYADLNQRFLADWQFNDPGTRFLDIFFDNFFTDWSVQERISKAQQTAQILENQLIQTISALKSQQEQSGRSLAQITKEFQQFLEQA